MRDLKTIEDYDALVQDTAADRDIVVFKFSPICPISGRAENEANRWYQEAASNDRLVVAKVDVIGARPVSQHIAAALGVRHESPQVLWLDGGRQVSWHASHGDVNQGTLAAREGAAS